MAVIAEYLCQHFGLTTSLNHGRGTQDGGESLVELQYGLKACLTPVGPAWNEMCMRNTCRREVS